MDECSIKVGDYVNFYDAERKNVSQQIVEKINYQYGRFTIKFKEQPFDHNFSSIVITPNNNS